MTELHRLTVRTSLLLYYVVAERLGSDSIMMRCPHWPHTCFVVDTSLNQTNINLLFLSTVFQYEALLSST